MKNKSALSSSGMFLAELLIAILVFAVASAICVRIFVFANFAADDSSQLNHAVIAAQNGAECFKASEGDIVLTAELLGAEAEEQQATLFLDKNWDACSQDAAAYTVTIARTGWQFHCVDAQITVADQKGEPLYAIPVSAVSAYQTAEADTEVEP